MQIGHQYRGIGEHLRYLVKYFPVAERFDDCAFTFYAYGGDDDPTAYIKQSLNSYPTFDVVDIGPRPTPFGPGLARYAQRAWQDRHHHGELALADADVDKMLFFDFQLGVPEHTSYTSTLIMYDLIPLLFKKNYYRRPSRSMTSRSDMHAAMIDLYAYRSYRQALNRGTANADRILTISSHTKSDLQEHLGIAENKMQPVLLGVEPSLERPTETPEFEVVDPSDKSVAFDPATSNYIFYLGGTDFRRQIGHLVDAFEQGKARIGDLKLVLAGADFASIEDIHSTQGPGFRRAVRGSNFASDVLFVGYISDRQRAALYRNAIAFVYPTLYEGFGLPILESMTAGCPVITYANSSTPEVGGEAALYTDSPAQTAYYIDQLANDADFRRVCLERGRDKAKQFHWAKTAAETFEAVLRD